jgi:hypothetical protein
MSGRHIYVNMPSVSVLILPIFIRSTLVITIFFDLCIDKVSTHIRLKPKKKKEKQRFFNVGNALCGVEFYLSFVYGYYRQI